MRMMKWAVVSMVVSLGALAGGPQQGKPGEGPRQDPAQSRARMEQRMRMLQVVGLSEVLELSTAEALKLDEILRKFDDRRRPLREQVRESGKIVRQAADGDAAALGQVDQATARILDARVQLAQIDKELFQTLSRDLSPQKRAKLAVFYGHFQAKLKGAAGMMFKRKIKMGMGDGDVPGEGHRKIMIRRGHGPFGMGMEEGPEGGEGPGEFDIEVEDDLG